MVLMETSLVMGKGNVIVLKAILDITVLVVLLAITLTMVNVFLVDVILTEIC